MLAFSGCCSWQWFPARYKLHCFCKQQRANSLHGLGKPWTRPSWGTAALQWALSLDRALIQQWHGQSRGFQLHSFQEGLVPSHHICCSWLQKEGNTMMISWVAFTPKLLKMRKGQYGLYFQVGVGVCHDPLFLKWGVSDLHASISAFANHNKVLRYYFTNACEEP